ncbi:MAG: hypothetical protein JNK87_37445 [Bryobacterales bacterium]|nr:hypothetical protein [Bryobacterales bacterium]
MGGLAWSADGRYLAEARWGPVIEIREVATGEVVRRWDEARAGRKAEFAALVFGPDGALYAHFGRQVMRYREAVRTKLFGYKAAGACQRPGRLQVAMDGSILLTSDGHGMDLVSGKRLPRTTEPSWTVDAMRLVGVALAPGRERYAAAWDVDDRRFHSMALGMVEARTGVCEFWLTQGEGPPPDQLWFGGEGRWVVAVKNYPREERRRVSMFRMNGETRVTELADGGMGEVAFSPDGGRMFAGAGRGVVVYEVGADGRWAAARRVELPFGGVTCLAVAPDGAWVAVGSSEGQVAVVEVG